MQKGIEMMGMKEEQVKELVNMMIEMGNEGNSTPSCPCEYDVFCVITYLVQKKEEYEKQMNRGSYSISQSNPYMPLYYPHSVNNHIFSSM